MQLFIYIGQRIERIHSKNATHRTQFRKPRHFSSHYWYRQRCKHLRNKRLVKNKLMKCLVTIYKKLVELLCTIEMVKTWTKTLNLKQPLYYYCARHREKLRTWLWQRKTRGNAPTKRTQCGGGQATGHNGSPHLDQNENYNPFSRCGTEWLSSNQILKCSLYLLHTQYQDAKHQNIYGLTHKQCSNVEFLSWLGQAASNNKLDPSTCIAQALRDAMSTEGPCPARVIGDNTHFRTVFINARIKSVSLVDPFGQGFSDKITASIKDLYNKDTSGTWSFTEWRVKLQHDTYNCSIWAIWMQEKWMQYWSQTQIPTPFEAWFANKPRHSMRKQP